MMNTRARNATLGKGARLLLAAAVCMAAALCAMTAAAPATRGRELPAGRLVRVETYIAKDSVRVGERLPVRFTVQYPESLTFLPAAELPAGSYTPVSAGWKEGAASQGMKSAIGTVVLFTLDLQQALLPPVKLLFSAPSGDTLTSWTDEVSVPVRLATTDSSSAMPLKSQWEAPRNWLAPVLIALAALVAAAGLLWWIRRRRARPAAKPAKPALPPEVIALRELARIENEKILDSGAYKEYYTLVIDVLRRYLEGRFGIDAMDKTSDELMAALGRVPVAIVGFEEMLRDADLVKFAKYMPGIIPGKRLMESARRIVAETTPREEEPVPADRAAGEGS
jgi:hypothetical protein